MSPTTFRRKIILRYTSISKCQGCSRPRWEYSRYEQLGSARLAPGDLEESAFATLVVWSFQGCFTSHGTSIQRRKFRGTSRLPGSRVLPHYWQSLRNWDLRILHRQGIDGHGRRAR